MTDKAKFVQILRDHKRILYKVINIYCQDKNDRSDLEQEIVIQLWKSFKSYNDNYKYSTWIYKIAMNVSISYFRSNIHRKINTSPINESIFQEIDNDDNTDEIDVKRKFLDDFMRQLDKFNKQILILYLEEYSYKEIAGIVGISETNVATKISRLKKKIQESINLIKQ